MRHKTTITRPIYHHLAMANGCFVHPDAVIGEGCRIYAHRIGPNARIGYGVTIGAMSEVDCIVGDHSSIQAGALLYHGVTIGKQVFIGPRCTTTNDCLPDALGGDWSERFRETVIEDGANIGAGVTILCGVTIGAGARVGIGSLVMKDIRPGWLAFGHPAHHVRPIPTTANAKLKVNP